MLPLKKLGEQWSFQKYRDTGFSNALETARKIAIDIGVDPIFPQKRVIQRKRKFDEISNIPSVAPQSSEELFRIEYFFMHS